MDEHAKEVLAIYDFDGTITDGDSFLAFLLFTGRPLKTAFRLIVLIPIVLLAYLGVLERGKAKQTVFSMFYSGVPRDLFTRQCKEFTRTKLTSLLRPAAMISIAKHQENRHKVVVLSASPDLILQDFCVSRDITLISTQVEIDHAVLTGKFLSPNCRGQEKVRRLRAELDLDRFGYIYAYGDSTADRYFMDLADESHFKPFRE